MGMQVSNFRWPAMMSNGRDGNFKGILMDTYESVEALRCLVWADSRWHGPAMMSNGRDGNFKGILTAPVWILMNQLKL